MINRRITRQIKLGNVLIGGGAPISIQSMTSTPTTEIDKVVSEIIGLEEIGCEIIRLGIPDINSARAIKDIKKQIHIPLVADIHFDYRLALESIENGADGIRLNPGNLKNKSEVREVIKKCKDKNIPIRVGVNTGSIDRKRYNPEDPEDIFKSAMEHIKLIEEEDYYNIKVSLKSSDVETMVKAYRYFSQHSDYPLHLGITEAGLYEDSLVKSSIGIGSLLLDGIGDTIRVSITGDTKLEIIAAKKILKALGLRKEGIELISCPTCARKEYDVVRISEEFVKKTKDIKKNIKVAIMGCVVNGPGEAMDADIGIAAGKKGAVLFKKGKVVKNLEKDKILDILIDEINNFS